ncbi:hypothetical protein F7018_03805 [Tenacibaculum aiptasiae]|uniref:Tetratricopeptide repeat protein n=1 Tax=Tenacibaculum aiptasiae TaxID=426481 RepID=A0A7J5APA3_9FLAO|nr:hypothetical protein [Tenacibaculum aiptasiae]KAB1159446.1 hypothetical protein F7018_03805 [Tenacibaculum aiptasiae]
MISLQNSQQFYSFFFLLIFQQFLFSQENNFRKDSISFEKDFNAVKSFKQDYKKAREFYKSAIVLLDSLTQKHPKKMYFKKRKADVLDKLSVIAINEGDFVTTLKQLNKAIELRKLYGQPDDAAYAYYLKGIVWVRQRQFHKVKAEYDSAYIMTERNIARGIPKEGFKGNMLSAYGSHYTNMDSIHKAEYYFKKAIKYVDSIGDKGAGAINRIQYAEVIGDRGRNSEALKLRLEAAKLYKSINYHDGYLNAISEAAISYNAMGKYAKAYQLKKQFIEYLKSAGRKDRLLLEYKYYIPILEKNKKYKEAFIAQKEVTTLRDSLRNAKNYKELADLDAKLKYQNLKAIDSMKIVSERVLIEERRSKLANTKFWSVITFLLLVSGIVTLFYLKKTVKVKEQAYQNILLNNKIATKTEEINELLTETIQHIKSKERIADNLQKLSNEKEGITLKSIIADLKANKADNAKLILIKQNIEQVNFDFIKKLESLHPKLTKTDIEICSLIRIGLNRKEVANLRNTSLEAVKSSRFRLKKKLNLSSEDSLDTYINSL